MKKFFALLLVVLLMVGCGYVNKNNKISGETDDPSSMILTGKVLEIYDSGILIDSNELMLVSIIFEDGLDTEVNVYDEVKVTCGPEILESYPNQAFGKSIEVTTVFAGKKVHTKEQLLAEAGNTIQAAWNSQEDTLVYMTENKENSLFEIKVSSLYEEDIQILATSKEKELLIEWFYNEIQISTENEFYEVIPFADSNALIEIK